MTNSTIHSMNSLDMVAVCRSGRSSKPEIFTDRHFPSLKLKPLIGLCLAHTVLPVCLIKELKWLCTIFTKFAAKSISQSLSLSHTHTNLCARCSSSSFIVTLSLIRQTACARAQFSGCSLMTNSHYEMGQMAVCCQNLPPGVLSSCSAPSTLVGTLFKKFSLLLNMPHTYIYKLQIFPGCTSISMANIYTVFKLLPGAS